MAKGSDPRNSSSDGTDPRGSKHVKTEAVLAAVQKLDDKDTQKVGVEEIRELVKDLDSDSLAALINSICSTKGGKPFVRREAMKLISIAIYEENPMRDAILGAPWLSKLLAYLKARLRDSDTMVREVAGDVLGDVARELYRHHGCALSGGETEHPLLKVVFETLAEPTKEVQHAAAGALSQAAPYIGELPKDTTKMLLKLLGGSAFHAKAGLLRAIAGIDSTSRRPVGLLQHSRDTFLLYRSALWGSSGAGGVLGCLSSKDWMTRRAAVECIHAMVLLLGPAIEVAAGTASLRLERAHRSVSSCKYDKVKHVREAVAPALEALEALQSFLQVEQPEVAWAAMAAGLGQQRGPSPSPGEGRGDAASNPGRPMSGLHTAPAPGARRSLKAQRFQPSKASGLDSISLDGSEPMLEVLDSRPHTPEGPTSRPESAASSYLLSASSPRPATAGTPASPAEAVELRSSVAWVASGNLEGDWQQNAAFNLPLTPMPAAAVTAPPPEHQTALASDAAAVAVRADVVEEQGVLAAEPRLEEWLATAAAAGSATAPASEGKPEASPEELPPEAEPAPVDEGPAASADGLMELLGSPPDRGTSAAAAASSAGLHGSGVAADAGGESGSMQEQIAAMMAFCSRLLSVMDANHTQVVSMCHALEHRMQRIEQRLEAAAAAAAAHIFSESTEVDALAGMETAAPEPGAAADRTLCLHDKLQVQAAAMPPVPDTAKGIEPQPGQALNGKTAPLMAGSGVSDGGKAAGACLSNGQPELGTDCAASLLLAGQEGSASWDGSTDRVALQVLNT